MLPFLVVLAGGFGTRAPGAVPGHREALLDKGRGCSAQKAPGWADGCGCWGTS